MKLFENKYLRLVVIILVSLYFIYFFVTNLNEIRTVELYQLYLLIPISFLTVLFVISNGYSTKIFVEKLGVKLSLKEWILLSITNSLGNLVLPLRGGLASNAIYLKRKYQFNYKKFITFLYASYIFLYSINWLMGVITKAYVFLKTGLYSIPIIIFLIILLLILAIFYYDKAYKFVISLKLFSRFKEILLGWSEVKKDKRLMLNLLFITVIGNIIASVILLLELKMIGIETDFFFAMFLTMIISFALPFSVLPGNLGIKEIFVIFSFGIVGISASQSIIISIIDRLVSLVILVLLFLIVQLVLKNDKSVQALFKMNSNLASNNLPNKGT